MVKFLAITLSLLAVVQVMDGASTYSDTQIEEIVRDSGEGSDIYTTHSETHRPVHVPVFERYPIFVPHPEPIAVPQYIRVPIPQPYPQYTHVEHKIHIPVYKIIPEIIEKPVPYVVEKPYPVEIERPFPVEVVKKLEVHVPKPYPVHMIYYKHISEDDPPPKSPKYGFTPINKYKNNEDFTKKIKTSQAYGIKQNNFDESFQKYQKNRQVEYENQISFETDEETPPKYPKLMNAFNGKIIDFPAKKFKFLKGNVKNHGTDKDFLKAMKHFYATGGKSNYIEQKPVKVSFANDNQLTQLTDENFPEHPLIIFNGKTSNFPSSAKLFYSKNQNLDENFPPNSLKQFHSFNSKASKQKSMKFSGKFSPDSRHEHRLNGY